MNLKKLIFIGSLGGGDIPTDGCSIKNYHIMNKLKTVHNRIITIDTYKWKSNPLILIKLFYIIVFNKDARYIISLNNTSAYNLIRFLRLLASKAEVIYWVIGGSIGKWMLQGKVDYKKYLDLKSIIVEGESMKLQMQRCGLNNVSVIPNFKNIIHLSSPKENSDSIRFIFLSRINESKGCSLILECAKKLNSLGLENKYSIDFYGAIENRYSNYFNNAISVLPNVEYKGFIDLRDALNYDKISAYDAMLFPTFWHGEGCPGIVIDAYMAGVPVLASDWNMNKTYIKDGVSGVIFSAKDATALFAVMKRCINGEIDLKKLSLGALAFSKEFDTNKVLSDENLKNTGIID